MLSWSKNWTIFGHYHVLSLVVQVRFLVENMCELYIFNLMYWEPVNIKILKNSQILLSKEPFIFGRETYFWWTGIVRLKQTTPMLTWSINLSHAHWNANSRLSTYSYIYLYTNINTTQHSHESGLKPPMKITDSAYFFFAFQYLLSISCILLLICLIVELLNDNKLLEDKKEDSPH